MIDKNEVADFYFNFRSPLVALAIHNGNLLADEVIDNIWIKESERILDEEPYTEIFTGGFGNRVIVNSSRYQVDLDLPRDESYYEEGLKCGERFKIRDQLPMGYEITYSHSCHDFFYHDMQWNINKLLKYFNAIFIYDFHSFNCFDLCGDLSTPEPAPDIIVGIENTAKIYFPLAVNLIELIQNQDYDKRYLDVRLNFFLKGGYFSRWVKKEYGNRVCCITVNINKGLFMDDILESVDEDKAGKIVNILDNTIEFLHKQIMYHYGSDHRI